MKKVALYCRVSSDDQKERETIENQVEILNTYVEMKENLEIYKTYLDDGVSGTVAFEEREAGKQLINDAKEGLFSTILVWKIDRFGRDTLSGLSAIETLRKYDIEIMSVTEPFDLNTPTGRFQFITYLNMAELERNNILDRMFLGATRAAKKGKWLGGIVPYGYVVNKDGYLEINEDEAKIIKKIFDMYVNDKASTLEIALYLNSLNIPTNYSRGKGKGNRETTGKWRQSTIVRILANTTYIGKHEYGKRSTRRKETIIRDVPQIIDNDLWERAKQLRSKNKAKSSRNTKHVNYLLKGLLKCAKCGRAYQGVSYKKGNLSYYVCSTKRGDKQKILGVHCDNININSKELDEFIWTYVYETLVLETDSILSRIQSCSSNNLESLKEEVTILKNEKSNIENEKSKILNLYRKNIITEEDVEEELNKITREKEQLNELEKTLNDKIKSFSNSKKLADDFISLMNEYLENVENITFEKKKELLNIVIKEIIIDTVEENGIKSADVKIIYDVPVDYKLSTLKFSRSRVRKTKLTLNDEYGLLIRNLRLKNKVTLKELSNMLDISLETLSHLECGQIQNAIKYNYYYNICKIFNINHIFYLKLYNMKENYLEELILKFRAYLGVKTLEELSLYIFNKKYTISDMLRSRNRYSESTQKKSIIIVETFQKLKNDLENKK